MFPCLSSTSRPARNHPCCRGFVVEFPQPESHAMPPHRLAAYDAKRDFSKTAEPSGKTKVRTAEYPRFVIQKHAASRLHFDLRLEVDGVFKSWAVTKGPSLDPKDRRLAVETEDHPLAYGDF